jgi:predicted TIM-barrel fold metal-dependent hydrolase
MESRPRMPGLQELKLFDSCVTLGRFTGPHCITNADELLEIMDHYGIAEALVHDYHARVIYPIENGNQRLLEAIDGHPRLHPVWVVEPPLQPGSEAAEGLVAQMIVNGVRAARLRLRAKGSLAWLWEDLLTALERHHIPTFLDFGTIETTLGELNDQDMETLREMALKHPGLPLILSHVMGGLGVHPGVPYLVRRVPNLYLDITGILEYWRKIAGEVGPERVLFATGMPFTDPGILVSNVQYALDLDDHAKRLICGENLRRLLGGVR